MGDAYNRRYVNKWPGLLAAGVVASNAGFMYAVTLFTPVLKSNQFEYDQDIVDLVVGIFTFAGFFNILPGTIYKALSRHHRYGPRIVLLLGALHNTTGFALFYLLFTGKVTLGTSAPHPYLVYAAAAIAGQANAYYDTVSIVTSVTNFQDTKGSVVAALKPLTGLSSGILATMYFLFFQDCASYKGIHNFTLFLAIVPPIIVMLASCFINIVPFRQTSQEALEVVQTATVGWSSDSYQTKRHRITPRQRFVRIYFVIILLMLYITLLNLISKFRGKTPIPPVTSWLLGAIMFALPLLWAWAMQWTGAWFNITRRSDEAAAESVHLLVVSHPILEEPGAEQPLLISQHAWAGDDRDKWPLWRAFFSWDFAMLLTIFIAGQGCGLIFDGNLTQIVQATQGPEGQVHTFLAIFSVLNSFGRLLFASVTDPLLQYRGVARTQFLVWVGVLACLAELTLVVFYPRGNYIVLYPVAFLIGLFYGGQVTLVSTIASELFGISNYSIVYSIFIVGQGVASLCFNKLAAYIYQAESGGAGVALLSFVEVEDWCDKHPIHSCTEPKCFTLTFQICLAIAAAMTVLSGALYLKSRPLYQQLHEKMKTK